MSEDVIKDLELSKELGVEVLDDVQVQERVRLKRNVGLLRRVKVLLGGGERSVDFLVGALGEGVKRGSVQSLLSQYVRKGVLVKTENGYSLKS